MTELELPFITPLKKAIYTSVKFFVEQIKCNPSHMDKDKLTPLHLAAEKGHLDIVKYLTLEQSCEPLCTSTHNNTPLHLAAIRGQLEVVKFFIETLHCPPDVRGWKNMTPLEWTHQTRQRGRRGHRQIVEYLESSQITKLIMNNYYVFMFEVMYRLCIMYAYNVHDVANL